MMIKGLEISRLRDIIKEFAKTRILIVGDMMLDEFIWGKVSRISPEAPVPVVWVQSESFMPGGACNVANNIRALGGNAVLAGVIGGDGRGRTLIDELEKRGVDTSAVITDAERPTTIKTRVIAHNQQVVRIDREKVASISENMLEAIITSARELINDIDGIIIEDYGKGVIVPRLLEELTGLAKRHKKVITVDPKEHHFHYYKGVTAITPNHYEAGRAVGMNPDDPDKLYDIGRQLLKELECDVALVTKGENGMAVFEKSGKITDIPTVAQAVYDVSGAGDTVISAYTMAMAAGARPIEAAHISNCAAGIVVGKVGVAVATREELLDKIETEIRR